ncbi:MAG: transcription antitermination factor NusB [Gemmatimonadota bacterium]
MSPLNPRSRSRSWALQALYAWEQGADDDLSLRRAAHRSLARRRVSDRYIPYLDDLIGWIDEDQEAIDALLRRHLDNWRLDRLTAIDRNILRIGVAELIHAEDVPAAVAIHEAMQLAQKYGSAESARFVNGVLDAVASAVRNPG